MSRSVMVEITCPECGHAFEAPVWGSVNVTLDPELKEKVLNGELWLCICPACGSSGHLDWGTLYHDQERRYMVLYTDEEDALDKMNAEEARMARMAPGLAGRTEGYRLRIVRSKRDLREKILIFDSGLDDRAVELTKRDMRTLLVMQEGFRMLDVELVLVSVEAGEEGEKRLTYLRILPGGEVADPVTPVVDLYSEAVARLQKIGRRKPRGRPWQIVDHAWAEELLRLRASGGLPR